jgi:hypothetical protein
MASSLSGGAGNDLVIPDDAAVQITSPEANNGIALVEFESEVSDINLSVGGDAPVKVQGDAVKNSVVRPVAAAGETAEIVFETTKVEGVTIVNEGEGAVDIEVASGTFKSGTIDLTGSSGAEADAITFGESTKLVKSEIALGENADLSFETKKVEQLTITSSGEGSVELSVAKGTFKKSTINLSEGSSEDSISFGGDTKVIKTEISLGAGKDTVIFNEGIKLKGNTRIRVGDGRDAIKIPDEVRGSGQLLISNFSKKDRLVVDGKKISGNKLYKGKKDAPNFIAIQFDDNTVFDYT